MVEVGRRESGRHQSAMQTCRAFPKQDVPKSVSFKGNGLLAEYDTRSTKFN